LQLHKEKFKSACALLLKCNCFLFSELGLALNSSSPRLPLPSSSSPLLQEEGSGGGGERRRRGVGGGERRS